ncbi:hypothetical protein A0J61_08301 [Choanephora cucurbitarum]|uniref:Uncharacterized protein n=1 Tax=Choanephora cucurbitarum TaxID=101091 RepID=A0A1C7N4U1_9FUNG|nr:hypothetical protein A0J61_08301 [Choanephora cucurbitarum]
MLQKISKFHKEDHSHPQGCAGERWLSPDMNDEEKQFEYQTVGDRKKTCYITIDKKTKRLCKTWLAAGFMILVGSLIVIAFVLTGLRRLAISSRQHHASITTTNNSINLIIPASTTTTLLLYPSTYVASTEFITHTPYTTVI